MWVRRARLVLRETCVEPCTLLDLRTLCSGKCSRMSRKNILIEFQCVVCPALALADACQQDAHIDIARIH